MNTRQTSRFDKPGTSEARPRDHACLFYPGTAALLLVLMFLGFEQFYLHGKAYPGRELAPPIRSLIILHGLSMSAWVILFLIQPLLILRGNRGVHRKLGKIGAVLAASIVSLGWWLAIEATRITPPDLRIWGLDPKQFMAVPILSILIFAGFVIIGVWNRRRPEVHRPMMLLAGLAAIPAAVSRIDFIGILYRDTLWETTFGPFFGTLGIGFFLMVLKYRLTRSPDRWLAIGYAGLVVASALIMQLATTHAWGEFAGVLLG